MKRVACIGAGSWGKNLIRVFHALNRLSFVCDTNAHAPGLQNLPSGIPSTRFFGEILGNPNIKAIVLATPAPTHYELGKLALEAGKDLFVEKPLALSIKEGQTLAELAQSKKLTLMTGHLMLYHPAVIELKRLVDSGEFGRPRYMTARRANWGRIRHNENVLWSFGPHDVSMLLHLAGGMPAEVWAFGQTLVKKPGNGKDICYLHMRWKDGMSANVTLSWMSPRKERELTIVGERKIAVFNDLESSEKICVYGTSSLDYPSYGEPLSLTAENIFSPTLDPAEPLMNECRHFLDCIDKGQAPLSGAENAICVLEVLEAADRSMKQGGEKVSLASKTPAELS